MINYHNKGYLNILGKPKCYLPVVPARGGAEVARPVRACFVRTCCAVVVQEHDLRATPAQCNAK